MSAPSPNRVFSEARRERAKDGALWNGLALGETGRDTAPRLDDVVLLARDGRGAGLVDAVVLVAPDDQVRLLAKEVVRDVILRSMRDAAADSLHK